MLCFSYSLTLIDALDMLVIMGNNSEFERVSNLVIEKMNFDNDINVSVFETNIRGLIFHNLFSFLLLKDLLLNNIHVYVFKCY